MGSVRPEWSDHRDTVEDSPSCHRVHADLANDTTDEPIEEVVCPICRATFASVLDRCPDDGARLTRSLDPMVGAILDGRYRIVAPLGEGAMGRIYLGTQLSVNRSVAIKVIRETWATDRDAMRRFMREAQVVTRLNHPNIVNVYDFGNADGVMYLVMELLRGTTLADELARCVRFDVRRACDVAIQLCDALAAAHACGVVHRDLKPPNVVLVGASAGRDLVKVLDFGLAKSVAPERPSLNDVTRTGVIMGTPLYLAPEAVAGDAAEPRSDLYALGCVLYEMLAGRPPFVDASVDVVLRSQLAVPPPPLAGVPMELGVLVEQLLAKDPEDRPASAAGVAARLQLILVPHSDLDEAPTFPRASRLPTPVEAAPRLPSAAVMLLLLAVLAAIACIVVVAV